MGQSENNISFYNHDGHSHDGVNSTKINLDAYSALDIAKLRERLEIPWVNPDINGVGTPIFNRGISLGSVYLGQEDVPAPLPLAAGGGYDGTGPKLTTGTRFVNYEIVWVKAEWIAPTQNPYSQTQIASYEVEIVNNNDSTVQYYQTTSTSVMMEPVNPNTVYNVRVRAINSLGKSSPYLPSSGYKSITSAVDQTAPGAISNLLATPALTSIIVTWDESSDADMKYNRGTYEIILSTSSTRDLTSSYPSNLNYGKFTTETIREFVPGTIYGFSGLSTGTNYYVQVRAIDSSGNAGPWTSYGSPTAVVPGGLTSTAIATDSTAPSSSPTPTVKGGPTYISAEWTAVTNADVVTYDVHLGTSTGFTVSGATKVGETRGTSFFIDHLPGATTSLSYSTNYYIRIVARDADGSAAAGTTSAAVQMVQVSTADISANAVTANEINAGSITTAKLAVGSVTVDKIAAQSITAEKLAIGSMSGDMLTNGSFENVNLDGAGAATTNPAYWYTSASTSASASTGSTNALAGAKALALAVTATPGSNNAKAQSFEVQVVGGQSYYFSAWARSSVAITSGWYFRVGWFASQPAANASADNDISQVDLTGASGGALTTSYVQYKQLIAAPAAAKFCRVTFYNFQPNVVSTIYVDQAEMRNSTNTTVIENGAITTNHITVGTLNGDRISAGTIAADRITAGSITTTQLSSGNISGTVITAGTLSADKITTGSLTSAAITLGSGGVFQTAGGATSGLKIDSAGIRAYDASNALTFNLQASTGSISLTGNIVATSGSTITSGTITGGSITGTTYKSTGSGDRVEIGGSYGMDSLTIINSFTNDSSSVYGAGQLNLTASRGSGGVSPGITVAADGSAGYFNFTNSPCTFQGEVFTNGWYRTYNSKGWYNETYTGGWYMIDSTWVRAYNSKNIYTPGGIRGDSFLATGDGSSLFFRTEADTNHKVYYRGLIDGPSLEGYQNVQMYSAISGATARLQSDGNFVLYNTGGGAWGLRSSRKVKTDIEEYAGGMSIIRQLRPVTFKRLHNHPGEEISKQIAEHEDKKQSARTLGEVQIYNKRINSLRATLAGAEENWNKYFAVEAQKPELGLIAEEVEEVEPLLVYETDLSPKSLMYQQMSVIFINAMKELDARIAALENAILNQGE